MRHACALLSTTALLGLTACAADPVEQAPAESTAAQTAPVAQAPQVPGLTVYESEFDVVETSSRIEDALAEAGMVVAVVDHAENADGIGEQLRPTTLVIGGAPPAGTPILQEEQRSGIDLPQKFLTWEAEDGAVYLGYNRADYVATRAGVHSESAAPQMLETASSQVASTASGTESPVSDGAFSAGVEDYLVEQDSDASVEESIARYEQAFEERDLLAVATVDHAQGAASIDEQLRPTQVTFAGNPQVGTTLLQASQTMGIDLPVRYLAYEDADRTVRVGHPDVRALAERHGVAGVDEVLDTVQAATTLFTGIAAGD